MRRLLAILLLVMSLSGLFLNGCSGDTAVSHNHPMAAAEDMPKEVQWSTNRVQEAYRFAVANPEIAEAIPCYCGCAGMHSSSYDCYVSGMDSAGKMQFDNHALSCAICIDITQDTMRLLDEGKTVEEIFLQIETDYAHFGPPTIKSQAGELQ